MITDQGFVPAEAFNLDLIQSDLIARLDATIKELDIAADEARWQGDATGAHRLTTIRDLIQSSRAYANAAVPIVNKINGVG